MIPVSLAQIKTRDRIALDGIVVEPRQKSDAYDGLELNTDVEQCSQHHPKRKPRNAKEWDKKNNPENNADVI